MNSIQQIIMSTQTSLPNLTNNKDYTKSYPELSPELVTHMESHLGLLMSDYIDGKRHSKFYDAKVDLSNLQKKYPRCTALTIEQADMYFKVAEHKICSINELFIDHGIKANVSLADDIKPTIQNIVDIFVSGLKYDLLALKNGLTVSDCGFFAPRRPTPDNIKKYISGKIAFGLYPPEDNTEEAKTKSLIWYQSCLSRLNRNFKNQEFAKIVEKEKYRISRLSEHRDLWSILKDRPISNAVLEPVAMPVEVAPKNELNPFFTFLKNDSFVDKEKANEYGAEWVEDDTCFKFTRGAIYTDGRMDLCKQVVGPPYIGDLMSTLKNNSQVKHFLLGNNVIGPNGGMAIKEFLLNPHIPKINTWYLAGNDLDENGISSIVDGLSHDNDAKELWLKRNPVKPNGAKHIGRLLAENKHLSTLDLHNTGLLDEGLKYVCDGLSQNNTLKYIYLEANGIKDISPLVKYFRTRTRDNMPGITSLWIGMNRFSDAGFIELCDALKDYPWITRFCVGSNMISGTACKSAYLAFKNHPSLRVLDLGMYKSTADLGEITNRIGDEGAHWIAELIKENTVLEYISVLHNDISNNGIKELYLALQENSTLLFFDFKQYFVGIEQNTHTQLIKKLQSNRALKVINNEKTYFRFLKHTSDIVNIDSIYRNNDKGASCSLRHVTIGDKN